MYVFFFFQDPATTEIYTRSIVGSDRCVQETGIIVKCINTNIQVEVWEQSFFALSKLRLDGKCRESQDPVEFRRKRRVFYLPAPRSLRQFLQKYPQNFLLHFFSPCTLR
eukprot:TRINITY_DN37037_c0_g1_i1.p4 TRINITY_DN37037_c0_g1~~TRINITY_DN37037_c0_g1_i1.p4  ORF type:complete len:109 (-),score=21.86 TRINITY_DN37037_c0_g1_i1:118-444(-)